MSNRVASGIKWNTLSTIVLAISGLLKFSILARLLEPEDFGLMAIVSFLVGFANVFMDLGLSTAIIHKRNVSIREYSSLYWFNVFTGLIIYGFFMLLSPYVAKFYEMQELSNLINLAGLVVIFSSIGRQFKAIAQKDLQFKFISIPEIVSAILGLIVAYIIAKSGGGVYSLVLSLIAQHFLFNLWLVIASVRKGNKPLAYFSYSEIKEFISIGIYQAGGQLLNYFNREIDILIVGKFFSQEVVGIYSLAKQLVYRPFQVISPIINKMLGPVLAKSNHVFELFRSNYLFALRLSSKLYIIAYFLLFVFAKTAILILYGESYLEMEYMVQLLSVFMLLRSLSSLNGGLLVALGKTKIGFLWNAFILIFTPVIVYTSSQISLIAVCWSLAILAFLFFIINWYVIPKRLAHVSFTLYLRSIFSIKKSDLRKAYK